MCVMYHRLLATYCVQKEPNKTEKNPKTKNIRCFINCSPNTVKHKRTKIYTIPYKVYLFCVPFLQFQPLTTLKLNYRPLSSLKKSENMAKLQDKKTQDKKIPCGNNDHISLFCSPLNYTRKKNLQSVYPCFLFSNDCFCGIPRSILPLSKGYLYHFNVFTFVECHLLYVQTRFSQRHQECLFIFCAS